MPNAQNPGVLAENVRSFKRRGRSEADAVRDALSAAGGTGPEDLGPIEEWTSDQPVDPMALRANPRQPLIPPTVGAQPVVKAMPRAIVPAGGPGAMGPTVPPAPPLAPIAGPPPPGQMGASPMELSLLRRQLGGGPATVDPRGMAGQ